jgi:pimeloyl-ACP methyl ester carboxylesterase
MQLYHQKIGSEGQNIIIIHGLFGSSDNWLTVGRVLAEKNQVYLIDQRNHGKSPHSTEWDYQVMAADLNEFIQSQNIQNPIILGHSMGGKTAMQYACSYFPSVIKKLIVADIAPKEYPLHHQKILAGLKAINLDTLTSRKQAEDILREYVEESDTRAFLLKNLYRDEQQRWAWRINLPVIDAQIANVGEGLLTNLSFDEPTLFVRGSKSNYILDEDFELIKHYFHHVQIETIEGAGHWLHAEKPQEFLEIIQKFIESS